MEVVEGSYFMYTRLCLKPFGVWPYQSPRWKVIFRTLNVFLGATIMLPAILKTYEFRKQFHYFLVCIPSLLYFMHYLGKFGYLAVREEQFRKLLERVKSDFLYYKGESLDVLHEYHYGAQKFNSFYSVYLCQTVFIFNVTGFIPQILDFIAPLNESRPRHEIRYIKFGIAPLDNSFHFKLIHGSIIDIIAIFIILGFDTLFINFAQHASALFKIVVIELRNSSKLTKDDGDLDDPLMVRRRRDQFYRRIVKSIITHKHALEFIYSSNTQSLLCRFLHDMELTYTSINFIMFGMSLATITITEFETIVYKDVLDVMIRFAFFTTGQLLNVLCQTWPGQRIKDHSAKVHETCYKCEWYRDDIPDTSKKLLLVMMMRSEKPSFLTAGKMFVLDLQTFVKICKASVSYFAFLSSVQE